MGHAKRKRKFTSIVWQKEVGSEWGRASRRASPPIAGAADALQHCVKVATKRQLHTNPHTPTPTHSNPHTPAQTHTYSLTSLSHTWCRWAAYYMSMHKGAKVTRAVASSFAVNQHHGVMVVAPAPPRLPSPLLSILPPPPRSWYI